SVWPSAKTFFTGDIHIVDEPAPGAECVRLIRLAATEVVKACIGNAARRGQSRPAVGPPSTVCLLGRRDKTHAPRGAGSDDVADCGLEIGKIQVYLAHGR